MRLLAVFVAAVLGQRMFGNRPNQFGNYDQFGNYEFQEYETALSNKDYSNLYEIFNTSPKPSFGNRPQTGNNKFQALDRSFVGSGTTFCNVCRGSGRSSAATAADCMANVVGGGPSECPSQGSQTVFEKHIADILKGRKID